VHWLIAASITTVALAPFGALAADLPPPVAPAVYAPPVAIRAIANWGGFYVGGNVGVGLARDQSTFSFGGVPFATTDTRYLAQLAVLRRDSIGCPARSSRVRKAILTGAISQAASARNARPAGR